MKCSQNINENFIIHKIKVSKNLVRSNERNGVTHIFVYDEKIIKKSRLKELLSGLFIFIQTRVILFFLNFFFFFYLTCICLVSQVYTMKLKKKRKPNNIRFNKKHMLYIFLLYSTSCINTKRKSSTYVPQWIDFEWWINNQ